MKVNIDHDLEGICHDHDDLMVMVYHHHHHDDILKEVEVNIFYDAMVEKENDVLVLLVHPNVCHPIVPHSCN